MDLNTQGSVHISMGAEEPCRKPCGSTGGRSNAPWTPEQLLFQLRRALSPRPGPPPSNSRSASQQLRKKEGVKYQHESEREQTGALEGGDKLWQRIKAFCQKLPHLLQECSFQARSLTCRQTHTLVLSSAGGSSAQRQLRG